MRATPGQFDYYEQGLLSADRAARPGSRGQSLARQDQTNGFDVTLTSAEGRATVHAMRFDGLQAGDAFPDAGAAKEYRFTKQGTLLTKAARGQG